MAEIEEYRKKNKNKNVERRLGALFLRAQGKKRAEVAEVTRFAASYITELTAKYCKYGIGAITENSDFLQLDDNVAKVFLFVI